MTIAEIHEMPKPQGKKRSRGKKKSNPTENEQASEVLEKFLSFMCADITNDAQRDSFLSNPENRDKSVSIRGFESTEELNNTIKNKSDSNIICNKKDQDIGHFSGLQN